MRPSNCYARERGFSRTLGQLVDFKMVLVAICRRASTGASLPSPVHRTLRRGLPRHCSARTFALQQLPRPYQDYAEAPRRQALQRNTAGGYEILKYGNCGASFSDLSVGRVNSTTNATNLTDHYAASRSSLLKPSCTIRVCPGEYSRA